MSRWRWIYNEGDRLTDIGINPDGSLHNPNGYAEATVRAAIAAAEDRRHQRRQVSAAKGAATRRRRHEKRVYDVAQRIIAGGSYGPSEACVICGRGLDDPESIRRGIGSDCWQLVLGLLEGATPQPERTSP
jgi:hypothetical protein